ncbi:gliding motility lipoprotein GldH [Bizionia sediminis]|uniref:Gliding motility lipoprotein GldH n=1 Tax=Bizionia sediminis TaxID=1737064 RepID=A0ABW5KTE1_9FLAO
MTRNKFLSFVAICLFTLLGCDSKQVLDTYKTLPNQWHKDSVVKINFKAPDSVNPYNLFVNVRNNHEYPFNNLFLIVKMNFPNGKIVADTLEYKMAKPDGTLLGTGFSDIKENKLWYKENVIFNESGTYQVSIQQAMRQNGEENGLVNLKGVTDVGFRIEYPEIPQ